MIKTILKYDVSLNTPEQVFKYLVREDSILNHPTIIGTSKIYINGRRFITTVNICSALHHLLNGRIINPSLHSECRDILKGNKPSEDNKYRLYTKSVHWDGRSYWWKTDIHQYGNLEVVENLPQIFKEKRRFLSELIKDYKDE